MYTFITDPGHGWLQVPLAEIKELGIAEQITFFSYMDATHAYLEEDCDLDTFAKAKRWDHISFQANTINRHTNGEARCRSMRSFDPSLVQ